MRALAPLIGFGAAIAPAAALACSPAFSLERYTPTAGGIVPANAVLQFLGPMPTLTTLQVGPLAGPLVDVTGREVPDESLWRLNRLLQVDLPPVASGTTARVLVDHSFGVPTELLVTPNAPADTVAPTATGPLGLSYRYDPVGDTCVPSEHFEVILGAAAVTDDVELANVTAYETTGGQRRPLSSYASREGVFGTIRTFVPAEPAGERCFALVFRDLAGNESAPLAGCIVPQPHLPDAGPTLDAGPALDTGPAPDASPLDDAGPRPDAGPTQDAGVASNVDAGAGDQRPIATNDESGCTCSGRPAPRGVAPGLGIGLLALVWRRRR